jgi:hypothetical protein
MFTFITAHLGQFYYPILLNSPLYNRPSTSIGIGLYQSVEAFAYQVDPRGPIQIFNNAPNHWETYIGAILGAATFMTADVILVRAPTISCTRLALIYALDLSVLHSLESQL